MSRRLKPDELDLWQEVTARAKPLKLQKPTFTLNETPSQSAVKSFLSNSDLMAPARLAIKAFEIGKSAPIASSDSKAGITVTNLYKQTSIQMDRKAFGRLRRGKIAPEARIDLHGMPSNN